jgi:type I restriction enzyme, R subunit
MAKLTSEQNFENAIVAHLVQKNAFYKAAPGDYDRSLCLIPATVLRFLQATQPEKWKSYKGLRNGEAEPSALKRIHEIIERKGVLYALRKGFDESGHHFDLCHFPPVSGTNPELAALAKGNIFQVLHDPDPCGGFKFSLTDEASIDLGLFLNGLPIFTAEVKNEVSGQNVGSAVTQYKLRNEKEPIFRFGRCLAHFALDTTSVYVTSHVQGKKKTRFVPFNKGNAGGAGNPPSRTGFATDYLWCDIWTKDSILDLAQRFIQVVDELDDKGRKTGNKLQVFPRYHQLLTVRECTMHARKHGAGFSYLNQHSAGSGKTNEIATLANSLATLHGGDDKVVFKTVIVLSDRRVVDRQLQRALEQFTQTPGLLENIETTSRDLKAALLDGKKIIVSTIQKFPRIVEDIGNLPGNSFAVIIDEAHSSQAGDTAVDVNTVLSYGKLEKVKDEDEPTWEDKIDEVMSRRGRMGHVSFFAFTATPKPETLQLFKTKMGDGASKTPFTLYSMRQAIEEKFILDVLENFTHYDQYFNLLKRVQEDPKFDRRKASALLRYAVSVDPHAVDKKARIMVDHFMATVAPGINGKAKAMIVTRSRLHAIRYAVEVRKYLEELGNPFTALVAFTGKVKDQKTGKEYTEPGMNGFSEDKLPDKFELDENRLLIVANKYQTGFDQPLLKAMYVDRKLKNVMAVQTLSRLNRTMGDEKKEVFVLDFENTAEDMKKAFQPFYDRIKLNNEVNPNRLYDILSDLADYGVYSPEQVDEFCKACYGPGKPEVKIAKMHQITDPLVVTFKAMEEDDQRDFKSKMGDYVKAYAFLAQIVPFKDAKLEKFFAFAGFLVRKLVIKGQPLPVEVLNMSDMENYKPEMVAGEAVKLERGEVGVAAKNYGAGAVPAEDDEEFLSKIIEDLNTQFGTKFTEEDKVVIRHLEEQLEKDEALEQQLEAGSKDAVRLSFEGVAQDMLHALINSNFKFYKKVQDDKDISRELFDRLFERYYTRKGKAGRDGEGGVSGKAVREGGRR